MYRHVLLFVFISSILVLLKVEFDHSSDRFQIATQAGLSRWVQPIKRVLSKGSEEESQNPVDPDVESAEADNESIEDIEHVLATPLNHREIEHLADWGDFFREAADEVYQPHSETMFVGENEQGLVQYVYINRKFEKVSQWFDEEILVVEELTSGNQKIARFFDYETEQVELIKWTNHDGQYSMEFYHNGQPKHLWINEDKRGEVIETFFQFFENGQVRARYYRQPGTDWIRCPGNQGVCALPSFQKS